MFYKKLTKMKKKYRKYLRNIVISFISIELKNIYSVLNLCSFGRNVITMSRGIHNIFQTTKEIIEQNSYS